MAQRAGDVSEKGLMMTEMMNTDLDGRDGVPGAECQGARQQRVDDAGHDDGDGGRQAMFTPVRTPPRVPQTRLMPVAVPAVSARCHTALSQRETHLRRCLAASERVSMSGTDGTLDELGKL